jgi:hypothetical protein
MVDKIMDGTIGEYYYDVGAAALRRDRCIKCVTK